MPKTFSLALGLGGARGLAHIAALEAIDELGVQPAAIAGTSIGALMGAAYASGMSGREMRAHVTDLLRDRREVMRRLYAIRTGRLADLISAGNPVLIDALGFVEAFLPPSVPAEFSALKIPLTVVATDFWKREQSIFQSGDLKLALAGSAAVPGLMRPVQWGEMVLVDGGLVNPLPFDLLRGSADVIAAIDVSGARPSPSQGVPNPLETMFASIAVMSQALIAEKLKSFEPHLLLRPQVETFNLLDFFRVTPILRAAEPVKEEFKRKLGALLES